MRQTLGAGALGLLAIGCCAGLPLLVAAGISAAAFAWIGGIAAGVIALTIAGVFLVSRVRASRRAACSLPSRPSKET